MATFNIRNSNVGQINESGTNVQLGGADGAEALVRLSDDKPHKPVFIRQMETIQQVACDLRSISASLREMEHGHLATASDAAAATRGVVEIQQKVERSIATVLYDPGAARAFLPTLPLRAVGASDYTALIRRHRRYAAELQSAVEHILDALSPGDLNLGAGERPTIQNSSREDTMSNRVFIVHGHDSLLKTKVARFVEKLGYEAVILHEQPSKGMTIIEKIASNIATGVGFVVVLYTPDDVGANKADAKAGKYSARARQNVVFEHGYLIAHLGRERVATVVSDATIDLPSDIGGVVYVSTNNWQMDIAKEMKAAGYAVDFNKLI